MLVNLRRPQLREEFFQYLENNRPLIASIVSQTLSLRAHQKCFIAERAEWKCGDFNVCVPVAVPHLRQRLMLRCPFPFMLGQSATASLMIDEKLRCEAGTYAWISQHCPQVPILKLWGFGLPSGLIVSVTSGSCDRADYFSFPHSTISHGIGAFSSVLEPVGVGSAGSLNRDALSLSKENLI